MKSTDRRRRAPGVVVATTAATALGVGLFATPPATAAPQEPHLHYTMDEIEDGAVLDVSGNDLHGALTGDASIVDAGDGNALALPGGNDGGYVTLPRGALEDAEDLTVSTRVRWSGQGGSWQWLYGLGTNNQRYVFTSPSNADGRLRSAVTVGGGGSEDTNTGLGSLPANQWVTLTVTLDSDDGSLSTYLNGALVDTASTDISADELLTSGAQTAGHIGNSFYADPRFRGDIEDFQIFHAALTSEEIGDLVGEVPAMTGLVSGTVDVRTSIGEAPELPSGIAASFEDGYPRSVPVTWEEIDPESYAQSGTFTVAGEAAGYPVTAHVLVTRGELRVDLSRETGDVHGGAAGLLYGLYADGMPTDNLIEGMNVQTVATKAQDGAQHPGSDALEVVMPLADTTGGDIYIRTTDWYRGFPYQWPGDTPEERLSGYWEVLEDQLDMILEMPEEYLDHIVIEPFNEPEGNMFGTGEWSYNGISWRTDPTDYFAAWNHAYEMIREKLGPDMRISGPNTSILYNEVYGFMEHAVESGTVPDIITWHELSHPQGVRDSVERYRGWEAEIFAGTDYEGIELPINVNEYAFNYHTSVPGQMIQWISAIEESKVDAMIAFWNLNGNLSDSAVQSNRANGQWWLFNAYSALQGHTVEVTAPSPGENYTLQGVASYHEDRALVRAIIGGDEGPAPVDIAEIPAEVFGDDVRVWVREIPWTGQLGDSAAPRHVAEFIRPVENGTVTLDFGGDVLPALAESSAYEILMTPAGDGESTTATPTLWEGSYEAEDADLSGSGYNIHGPEGSPDDVGRFYTSGGYYVSGLNTGSDVSMDFEVTVPEDGVYDLRVFANSLNTHDPVQEQGPTNVFLSVDGEQEQELFLPLGYKWVVWDYEQTQVALTEGTHTITLAAASLDGSGTTLGHVNIDRITLALPNPEATADVYEAELAHLDGGATLYGGATSGSGAVELASEDTAVFWVYSDREGESLLRADIDGTPAGHLHVNGRNLLDLSTEQAIAVHLEGGVNKIEVHGPAAGTVRLDRLVVTPEADVLPVVQYQAEDGQLTGDAEVAELSLADSGAAVIDVGGEPGNDSTLTFEVAAEQDGAHAVVFRYSNPEQVPATHYNPNPMGRHADLSVNGGEPERVMFPPTFHENNFWERTVVLDLVAGENTITISAEELPNFDGVTYAQDNWPGIPLRAQHAPIIDWISVTPLSASVPEDGETREFSDVPVGHGFYEEISWLADQGITRGYSDGTFRPGSAITREAMAAFLHRYSGSPEVELPASSPFVDVSPSEGFYREIVWMYQEGIASGWETPAPSGVSAQDHDPRPTFRPRAPIQRQAMAAFLYRYDQYVAQ